MAQLLLETKLFIPHIATRIIDRPELVARLDQGKFTLISAPAGFGKTTLLGQWVRDRQKEVAWISLDGGDNDPRRFLAYLVGALRKVGIVFDESLLNAQTTTDAIEPGAIGTTIVNKIVQANREIILVFDDYHVITNQNLHKLVEFLVQHQPPALKLIVATRADPPLPLAKLRASGDMTELRAEDLRLKPESIEAYLKDVQALNLSTDDAEKLLHRTEGWMAGLQLVSLALRNVTQPHEFIDQFTGGHAYIAEYLTDEVFGALSPEIQDFLLSTCLLERFCAELCDAVRDAHGSDEILMGLMESNSFLASLDGEFTWFRYHGLFADMLQQRLQAEGALDSNKIYERASLWFEQAGLVPEAINYAMRGKMHQRALDLLEGIILSLVSHGEFDTIISWVDQVPKGMLATRPIVALIVAWIQLVRLKDPSVAEDILNQLSPEQQPVLGMMHAVQAAGAVFLHSDLVASEEHAVQALTLLPEDETFFRPIALWNLSAAYFLQGRNVEGLQKLHETVESTRRSGNLLLSLTALCRIGSVAMQDGDLVEARRIFEEALALSRFEEGYVLPVAFAAKLGLAKIYREWNQPEAAYEHLQDSLKMSSVWNASYTIEAYDTLAFVQDFMGDEVAARSSLEKARTLAEETEITRTDDTYVASQQALLNLRQGDVAAAAAWASRRAFDQVLQGEGGDERSLGASIIRIFELMVFARFLLGEKRPADALLILKGLEVEDNPRLPMAKRIEYTILEALVHAQLNQGDQVRARLQAALELAQPGGYIRPFVEEGRTLHELLKKLPRQSATSAFQAQLLEALEGGYRPQRVKIKKPLAEPLTGREQEVLKYLISDLTVPEIAVELGVAESTVRSHIKHIYSKLNVHNRYEAVDRAKAVGLL